MKLQDKRWCVKLAAVSSIILCGFASTAFAAYTIVPRAVCGPGDHPESGLQGQVPAALRASGYTGFSCNLELIGQARGDGANWQTAEFVETRANGNICGYHGTASPTASLPGRTLLGSRVLDLTNAGAPQIMGALTTVPMLDPWESIKVNQARQLLAADDAWNGGHGPLIDFYDLSQDCRFPQLLGSVTVGTTPPGQQTKKLQQAITQSRLSACSFFWRVQLFECNPCRRVLHSILASVVVVPQQLRDAQRVGLNPVLAQVQNGVY
jgi:hypothetical protein